MSNNRKYIFLIGAQKSGTSTIYDLFDISDDVYAPSEYKDFHIFNEPERFEEDIECLKNNRSPIVMHAAVNYVTNRRSIENINRLFPDAYYVLILRDPIKRAISAFKYLTRMGVEAREINIAFDQELRSPRPLSCFDSSYLNHGLYAKQLIENVFPVVSRDRVGIFFYEDIFNDNLTDIDRLICFLGMQAFYYPKSYAVNVGGEARFTWLNRIVYQDGLIRRLLGTLVPVHLRTKIKRVIFEFNRKSSVNGKVSNKISSYNISRLKRFYADDMRELSKIVGRDLEKVWFKPE